MMLAPGLASQFSYLRTLPRLTRAKLDELNASMTMPDDLIYKPPPPPILTTPVSIFEKFDIRRYTTEPRRKSQQQRGLLHPLPGVRFDGERHHWRQPPHHTGRWNAPSNILLSGLQCQL